MYRLRILTHSSTSCGQICDPTNICSVAKHVKFTENIVLFTSDVINIDLVANMTVGFASADETAQ
jgi:hypothetical protein